MEDSGKALADPGTSPTLCSSAGWGPGRGLPVISGLLLRPSRAALGPGLVFVPVQRPSQEGQAHVHSPINPAGVAHYNVLLHGSAGPSPRGLRRPRASLQPSPAAPRRPQPQT